VRSGVNERVVENWLTSADERTLEVPFCQLLVAEGFRVVHLSRHGEWEQGKDILAIAPDDTPCAFQLKATGHKVTLAEWASIFPQIVRLVEVEITHPSIPPGGAHRAILVINGELDEAVRQEISDRNRDWVKRGRPALETWVRNDLLPRFLKLHTNLWPTELHDWKALLELFLASGDGCLRKPKLSQLLYSTLPFGSDKVKGTSFVRAVASAAMLTSYALQPHEQKENHVAVIEGWTLYAAHVLALADCCGIAEKHWSSSISLAEFAIQQAMLDLVGEIRTRTDLTEGDPVTDGSFRRARVTWLCALLAAFCLWRQGTGTIDEADDVVKDFILRNRTKLELWGEATLPQILVIIWYLRRVLATSETDTMLATLTSSLLQGCLHSGDRGFPDPYHSVAEVSGARLGLGGDVWDDGVAGHSYGLRTLVDLLTRRNLRQTVHWLWPEVSRCVFVEFIAPQPWKLCLWHCDKGTVRSTLPKHTQSWSELQRSSSRIDLSECHAYSQSVRG